MMPDADGHGSAEPLRVSILTQGGYLIASIHTALDDSQLLRFRDDLLEKIDDHRSGGVIIDVAALDVIDSFACHTLRCIAAVVRLRGAKTVVVGIKPDVAVTMVRLGASLDVRTALDLEEGLEQLESHTLGRRCDEGRSGKADQLGRLHQHNRARFLRNR
jgi:rsbT antagonist protein RsbS